MSVLLWGIEIRFFSGNPHVIAEFAVHGVMHMVRIRIPQSMSDMFFTDMILTSGLPNLCHGVYDKTAFVICGVFEAFFCNFNCLRF